MIRVSRSHNGNGSTVTRLHLPKEVVAELKGVDHVVLVRLPGGSYLLRPVNADLQDAIVGDSLA